MLHAHEDEPCERHGSNQPDVRPRGADEGDQRRNQRRGILSEEVAEEADVEDTEAEREQAHHERIHDAIYEERA